METNFDRDTSSSLRRRNGEILVLQRKLVTSGEGVIYSTDDPLSLAKIYHASSLEKAQKLEKMIESPPQDPTRSQGHISIAWPQDLILNKQGAVVGFLMPKIKESIHLTHVYNPRLRRKFAPGFNWYYLHTTALNVAWILKALHEKGCVVGDLKSENFLVSRKALVTILDTDSFQIYDEKTKILFRSPVASEGFTPRELIGKDLKLEKRTELHDRFGLSVLIYLLLFGVHPFAGVWQGEGEAPTLDSRIFQGLSPLNTLSPFLRSPLTLPLSILPPLLFDAFTKAFVHGHLDPSQRPSASEWIEIFKKCLDNLELCSANLGHFYYPAQGPCPWCKHLLETGVDVFKNTADKDRGDAFITIKQFEKTLKNGDVFLAQKLFDSLKTICDSTLLKSCEDRLNHTKNIFNSLDPFVKILNHTPFDDQKFLETWERFSFKEQEIVQKPLSLFYGYSLNDIVEKSRSRAKLALDLEFLLDDTKNQKLSPLTYFDDLLRLWDKDLLVDHPMAKKIEIFISPAQELFKNYILFKSALLNKHTEEVLLLWDPFFENRLKRDGLFQPFLNLLQEFFKTVSFDFVEHGRLIHHKGGLSLKIRCQNLPSFISSLNKTLKAGIFIEISKDFSESPFFIPLKKIEALDGEIFIPTPSQISSLFVRPVICLDILPIAQGKTIEILNSSPPIQVFTHLSISKPFFLKRWLKKQNFHEVKIILYSKEKIVLPALVIRGGFLRTALMGESPPDAFTLGHLNSISLNANVPLFIKIPLQTELPPSFLQKVDLSLEVDEAREEYKQIKQEFFFSKSHA